MLGMSSSAKLLIVCHCERGSGAIISASTHKTFLRFTSIRSTDTVHEIEFLEHSSIGVRASAQLHVQICP